MVKSSSTLNPEGREVSTNVFGKCIKPLDQKALQTKLINIMPDKIMDENAARESTYQLKTKLHKTIIIKNKDEINNSLNKSSLAKTKNMFIIQNYIK